MGKYKILFALFGILIFLTRVHITNVCACSPVIYYDTTIITVDQDEFDDSPEYNYDLLFHKVDYPEFYQETVNNRFIATHPNYESFTFLDDGDWVSYKAHYSSDQAIWESGSYHEFHGMNGNAIQEYKIIVFDDEGNIIKISSVYNKDDFGFYEDDDDFGSVAHTFDEGTELFGVRAIGNGCAGWSNPMYYVPFIMFGILGVLFVAVLVMIIGFIIRIRKR